MKRLSLFKMYWVTSLREGNLEGNLQAQHGSCPSPITPVPLICLLLFPLLPAEKKDTVLRQVRLDPCDLQPIFDDMLHVLNPEELRVIEEIPQAEDKLDRLFEIIGVKSQEASQTLLDSVYSHLPDLL